MSYLSKKSLLMFGISAMALAFLLCDDFVIHRRGWHTTPDVQYNLVIWTTRLILTPALISYNLKYRAGFDRPLKLFLLQLTGIMTFLIVQWSIAVMILSQTLPAGAVSGGHDLFNRIRESASAADILICISGFCIFYLRVDIEPADQTAVELAADKLQKPVDRITVKIGTRIISLPVEQVICFRSDGQYIEVVIAGHSYLIKQPLYRLNSSLPPDIFLRVHRSCIVNTRYVREVRSLLNGDYVILLEGDIEVRASRTYKRYIQALTGSSYKVIVS
ncbi:MAG: LytTR family transcriptional regulator [Bacteroidetes bacterium]|nr:LytTR family transcriptional regulator [Bacteroidota bacterium]